MQTVIRKSIVYIVVLVLGMSITNTLSAKENAQDTKRPIVLVFEASKGEGVDKELAKSTTKAIKNYLRDTLKVEPLIFDRESPTVARAIMETKITQDNVASYASQNERLEVAKTLMFDYAAGAEVSLIRGDVAVKLWLGKVDGDKWESSGLAGSAGTGPKDLDNAMQSAASSAVLNIAKRAFDTLPYVAETKPATGDESIAIDSGNAPKMIQPSLSDYTSSAEDYLKSGNLAMAIQQYQRAVNIDPANSLLRIKLAEAYAARAMFKEADDELTRAESMGASADAIAIAKEHIDKYRGGQAPLANLQKAETKEPAPRNNVNSSNAVSGSQGSSATAIAKMIEGDKHLKAGKPDEAADAYKESISINPADWRAYERLALANAAMSMYGESRKALEELNRVQPNPPASVVASRYEIFRTAFDRSFAAMLKHYDDNAASFANHTLSREIYYGDTSGLILRLEAMAKFLDYLTVPSNKQSANLHRSLACGLMVQAASDLLEYLESNSDKAKENAATFVSQVKKEIDIVSRLETGATASTTNQ